MVNLSFSDPVATVLASTTKFPCMMIGFECLDFVPKHSYIGIDPGYNFGIAVLEAGKKHGAVWYGKLPEAEDRPSRAYLAELLVYSVPRFDYQVGVVEGANYKASAGQVLLAEVRYSFWRGLMNRCQERIVAAPSTIRKGAFGSGKTAAYDLWPNINHNAADSVGCVLYARSLKEVTNAG